MEEQRQPEWLPGEKRIVFTVLALFLSITLTSLAIVVTTWGPW